MPSGARIRTDNVFGTLTDNPLTNVATTMNSAGLANLAAVASAHAIIVIDPLRTAGAPEAVIVTAHTASATSATITRGAYGTSARQHASGVMWVHTPNVEDFIRIVTASTRPSNPYEGQLVYETDTDAYSGYTGAAWQTAIPLGAWTTYTPSNTNVTLGNAVQNAFYARVGRIIHVRYKLLFGTTTAFTASVPAIGLPTAGVTGETQVLSCSLLDAGARWYTGTAVLGPVGITGSDVSHAIPVNSELGNAGLVNNANPFGWASADMLMITGVYEAAA